MNDHLHWGPDPSIFTIPEFYLPFSLSIPGLILAAVVFYFGWQRIKPTGSTMGAVGTMGAGQTGTSGTGKSGEGARGKSGHTGTSGTGKSGKPDKPSETTYEPWKGYALAAAAIIIGQVLFMILRIGPTLDSIGPIAPRWYGVLFATAFITGYIVTSGMMRRAGRTPEEIDRLLIYMLLATVIGARLGHVFFYNPEYYLRNLHLIPQVWTGGLASHGAAIGIIFAMWLYARRTPNITFLWVADRIVPAVAIGGTFIRIGNFMNSEILGKASDLPWAVVFEIAPSLTAAERLIPRHPSMLYESAAVFLIFLLLIFLYRRHDSKPPEGLLFGTFLVALFTSRFLIEFTKLAHSDVEAGWILNMGSILSIPLVLYGAWLLLQVRKRGA